MCFLVKPRFPSQSRPYFNAASDITLTNGVIVRHCLAITGMYWVCWGRLKGSGRRLGPKPRKQAEGKMPLPRGPEQIPPGYQNSQVVSRGTRREQKAIRNQSPAIRFRHQVRPPSSTTRFAVRVDHRSHCGRNEGLSGTMLAVPCQGIQPSGQARFIVEFRIVAVVDTNRLRTEPPGFTWNDEAGYKVTNQISPRRSAQGLATLATDGSQVSLELGALDSRLEIP